jgi:hypothetical protein
VAKIRLMVSNSLRVQFVAYQNPTKDSIFLAGIAIQECLMQIFENQCPTIVRLTWFEETDDEDKLKLARKNLLCNSALA